MGKIKLFSISVLALLLTACGGPTYTYEAFGDRTVVTELPETEIGSEPMYFDSDGSLVSATYMLASMNGWETNLEHVGAEYEIDITLNNTKQFYVDSFEEDGVYPLEKERLMVVNSQDFAKEAEFSNPRIKVNINLNSVDGALLFRVTNDYTYDLIDELY